MGIAIKKTGWNNIKGVMKMNDDDLNEFISKLSEDGDMENIIPPGSLGGSGKLIPYIGWYWRRIDFDNITLGDCGSFIGFMGNNKWDYKEWIISGEQAGTIRQACIALVGNPSQENYDNLFKLIQGCVK